MALLLVLHGSIHSQICRDNNDYDRWLTISGGTPFNLQFEAGAQWSVPGVALGIKTWGTSYVDGKTGLRISDAIVVPYVHGFIQMVHSSTVSVYATGWAGLSHSRGASLRLAYEIPWWIGIAIIAEPSYSHELGTAANFGVSMKF